MRLCCYAGKGRGFPTANCGQSQEEKSRKAPRGRWGEEGVASFDSIEAGFLRVLWRERGGKYSNSPSIYLFFHGNFSVFLEFWYNNVKNKFNPSCCHIQCKLELKHFLWKPYLEYPYITPSYTAMVPLLLHHHSDKWMQRRRGKDTNQLTVNGPSYSQPKRRGA